MFVIDGAAEDVRFYATREVQFTPDRDASGNPRVCTVCGHARSLHWRS